MPKRKAIKYENHENSQLYFTKLNKNINLIP